MNVEAFLTHHWSIIEHFYPSCLEVESLKVSWLPGGKGICRCLKFTNLRRLGIFYNIHFFVVYFVCFFASLNMYCTFALPCCLLEEWDLKLYSVWQLKAEQFQLCLKCAGGILQKGIIFIIRSPQILGAWMPRQLNFVQ